MTIVDSAGHEVATVMADAPAAKGLNYFYWNGRTSAGRVAPEGKYQPEVELANARRTILMPNKIVVDTAAPKVLSASDGDGLLISGSHHTVAIHYVFNGRARARVYAGGRRVIGGRSRQPRDEVKWNGKRDGKALPPGRYVLEVAAVDLAGNETPPAGRKRVVVRIRQVALGETPIHVAARARFTVEVRTAAKKYTWKLAGKHGSGTTKLLHLRAPSRPGRYRLVVSVHRRSASALVIVGKK